MWEVTYNTSLQSSEETPIEMVAKLKQYHLVNESCAGKN